MLTGGGCPCLERQITVLVQGPMDASSFDGSSWEETRAAERSDNNSQINTTKEKLVQLIESFTQTSSQLLLLLPSP
jgi:hypothetical protein